MSEKIPVAQRLSAVKPSATVAVAQRARELKAQGIDVLSDFDTPVHIREAAKKAIDSGATRYTAARGIVELREAICEASAKRRAGVTYDPSQVVVSVGAKHTLFNLALALYDEGDEVLIPAPYWVSYPEQVRLAGATPVIVQTTEDEGFRMTPEALRAAITPKTKALILCSPSNPTGAAYTGEQLRALADVSAEHNFWIIVDEIYGQLVYGGFDQKSIVEVAPDLKDRIIIVDGVSKTFAMTGWRIGWMFAPEYVTKACEKIQGQATTNPSSIAQHAAIAALRGPWEPMEEMRQAFEARRSIIVEGLNAIDGISCGMPEGAFYAFANVQPLIGKQGGGKMLETDVDVAGYLLEEARCAVVPGTAFGAPGFVRISYAASNDMIREGLSRIGEALSKLG
ncbi:MAG: pyridoxal phosphate-dependent aminotransferase [Deltaproteobacteria bacterium]|nr:pyridoxal phosphate-dependent aminotransferase [Deltaproteobacteria bacterium]